MTLKTLAASAALLILAPAQAHAAPDAAPDPALAISTNIAFASGYRFRGIDQTWGRPALQAGVDASHGHWSAGAWASNVSGNAYPGTSLELDLYASYTGRLGDDLRWTAGLYAYLYPGANVNKAACPSAAWAAPCALPDQRFDTVELNAGLSWKWLSYKLSISTGDYFGASPRTGYSRGTGGTLYHDLSASWPLSDTLSLAAHVGRTDLRARYGGMNADVTDYRLALTQALGQGWSASAALVGASNDAFFRPPTGGLSAANGDTRNLARDTLVLQLARSF